MSKCLVVYSTKYGSTREVAEAVAESLSADTADAEQSPSLDPYDVVVLGSPIYAGDYMSSMVEFIRANEAALKTCRIAAFITAAADMEWDPGLTGDEDELLYTQQDYAEGLAKLAGGQLLGARGFGGRLDPEQLDDYDRKMLSWFYRHLMNERLQGFDLIDLDKVRQWAEEIKQSAG